MDTTNRLDKFFDAQDDMSLEISMAYEYLTDLNQQCYIYQVDISNGASVDALYNEVQSASEIVLKDPIPLLCIIENLEEKNIAYNDNNTLRISETGNMLIHVLIAELKFHKCSPKYGDYVVYMINDGFNDAPMPLVFQIANPGNKTYENVRSWGGVQSYFRTLVCTPTDRSELNFEF